MKTTADIKKILKEIISHEKAETELRRDPLTGEYVNVAVSANQHSLTGRIQANGNPVAGEAFDPNDPLLRLGSSEKAGDEAWETHHETIGFAHEPLDEATGYTLPLIYIDRFEKLVPRSDISELLIVEERKNGRIESTITGYVEPTVATTRLQFESARWTRRTGNDLLADILTAELIDGERILINSDHWIVYRPYAAAHATEYIIMPKRLARNIVAIEEKERTDLARVYSQVYSQLISKLGKDAEFRSRWEMAPIPFCREVSRMRIHIMAD